MEKSTLTVAMTVLCKFFLPLATLVVVTACQSSMEKTASFEESAQPESVTGLSLFEGVEPSTGPPIEVRRSGSKLLSDSGPAIRLFAPPPSATFVSPGMIDIRFESSKGRVIDTSSFRLKVRKGFLWLDISGRVREFISPQGIFIQSADLGGFPGRYRLRIAVSYVDGGTTEQEFEWILASN